MWTRIPYSARIGLPVRQYVMGAAEAARKPILPHGKIRTEKNGKNSTERYGIPNFRRFRKSLATSDILHFTRGEGYEATSPSFSTTNMLIEASSMLLEALIASSLPVGGIAK